MTQRSFDESYLGLIAFAWGVDDQGLDGVIAQDEVRVEDRVVMLDGVIAWDEAWVEDRVVMLDDVTAWDEA